MSSSENFTKEEIVYQKEVDVELDVWEDLIAQKPENAEEMNAAEEKKSLEKFRNVSDEEMKELLYKPLPNKKALRAWIKTFLNCDLPDTTVDPDSDSNPLDMVWKLYETAVHYDKVEPSDRYLKSLFYCARGSFKTMCACIAELLIMLHTNRNLVHIGLIESQAKNAYNMYFRPFLDKPFIREYAKLNSILERSTLKNSEGDQVTLQVIPLTLNKTSSPRAQLVAKDEVDKTKGEQVQAYENVHGMLTMTNDRKMSMEFDISSRDSAHGMVQKVIDNAERTGCKVHHWNRIDITERCPDERSGNVPIPIYTKIDTLIAISEEEYLELEEEEAKMYELQWGLEGCLSNCRMFGACRGYLKNQTSDCKWLKPVGETEEAIVSAPSEEMAISQLLCRTPPKTGLVYSDFDNKKSVLTPAGMYHQWKCVPHRNERLTTDMLIREFRKAGLKSYIGVDAGFHNPAAIMMFIDERGQVFIVKEYMPHEVDSVELAQWLKVHWFRYGASRVFVDPESPDCTRAIKKKGFNVSDTVDKKRQLGIATVKGFIRPPTTRITTLFVNRECMGVIAEFHKWAYKVASDGEYMDETEKKFDHAMDAIRYVLHTLFGKARANIAYGKEIVKVDIGDSSAYRVAGTKLNKEKISPMAIARMIGHTIVDNRSEVLHKDDATKKKKKASTAGDFTDC